MTVNPEGAEVVRLIFHKYAQEGKGTHVIARELREEGICPMRVKEWSNTVILRVIRNEKYCGDLVQKKTYTPDYLDHRKRYNCGEEEFVIIRDHHEPIISRELFEKANRIADQRALSQEGKAKYSSRYVFSGKIKCGMCGRSFAVKCSKRRDGSKAKLWRCGEAVKHGRTVACEEGKTVGCSNDSIRNENVVHIMCLAAKNLRYNRNKIIGNLIKVIRSVLEDRSEAERLEEIKTVLCELADGVECEDEFYRSILDKMVIVDRQTVDVYLNILPDKWRFELVVGE